MPAVAPYTTGTATVTSGSAVVTGTGTAWSIGVVNGGVFSRLGLSIPILSVDSATQLTLAYTAPAGMAGTGAYAIDLARAGAADAVTANARLAQLVAQLQGISAFSQTILDDPDAATVRATIAAVGTAANLTDLANRGTAINNLMAVVTAGGADANGMLTPGRFDMSSDALNLPIPLFGRLIVEGNGTQYRRQTYFPMAGGSSEDMNCFYTRHVIVGSAWSRWAAFNSPTKSISGLGWRTNSDGSIEQWGNFLAPAGTSNFSYPLAFPNNCFSLQATVLGSGTVFLGSLGATSFPATVVNTAGASISAYFYWRAIGR
jgi:hypothetical protein